jgi:hypothetical protein
MDIDGSRHDDKAMRRQLLLRWASLPGRHDGGNLAILDGDVADGASVPRQNGLAAFDHKIESFHRKALNTGSTDRAQNGQCVVGWHHIGIF